MKPAAKKWLTIVTVLLVVVVGGITVYLKFAGVQIGALMTARTAPASVARPADWAQSMPATPGMSNFYKVSDDLYRGAQPDAQGFAELKKLGIKTIINLRQMHSDKKMIDGMGFNYVAINSNAATVDDDEVVEFLKAVADRSKGPFFVHCQHGSDRTGTMCAVYRAVVQDWDRQKAEKEFEEGGYGFHEAFRNLVTYIRNMDAAKLKAKAGIQ